VIQLFNLQIIDDSYKFSAINNSQRVETEYPARGLIFDRNNRLLVYNQAAYDLQIIPRQMSAFDTTELITILGISKENLIREIRKAKRYSRYKSSTIVSQITDDKYAMLQEKLYKYPGFFIQTRTLRKYNTNHSGDVYGYIGEVGQGDLKDPYYSAGDYIGINGLEKTYENVLRGTKGKRILLVDNYNRIKGSYKDGEEDEPAEVGENLYTTLDIDLQEYAYKLMQNKKGGIIAIEPSTGEILLKVSAPGYDPNLMVGLQRTANYRKLQQDTTLPLFDRTVMGIYSPGSIFKTVMALVGMEEKVITQHTMFECHGGSYFNRQFMKCHYHESPLALRAAIEHSCNPYFVNVYRRLLENPKYNGVRDAYDIWRNYVASFGFGKKVSFEFLNEGNGFLPSQDYFDKKLKTKNWFYTYIMSLAIGQGEFSATLLQMANLVAILANNGHYITPHIVRPTDAEHAEKIDTNYLNINNQYFGIIADAMEDAVKSGTAKSAHSDSIVICGKTGTIQNNSGPDHSAFFAFAPKENPKIAILVYVENGVWGSRYAAPIAGLIIEKYLLGDIPTKKRYLEKSMLQANLINPTNEKNATSENNLTEE
jgi:penicillin-binding protein 2